MIKKIIDHWFMSVFFLLIFGVIVFSLVKIALPKNNNYVYATVKVSQGYWWATTAEPAQWLVDSLQSGMTETSLLGKPKVEILSVRHYPSKQKNRYNLYLDVKLKAETTKNGEYHFNRSNLGVSAPIEFEFPQVKISGTVIGISKQKNTQEYITKLVTLEKPLAQNWEDKLQPGDHYHNGQEIVLEILNVDTLNRPILYAESSIEKNLKQKHLKVTAQMKLTQKNGQLTFGEEQLVKIGQEMILETGNFYLEEYIVSDIKNVD